MLFYDITYAYPTSVGIIMCVCHAFSVSDGLRGQSEQRMVPPRALYCFSSTVTMYHLLFVSMCKSDLEEKVVTSLIAKVTVFPESWM